MTDTDRILEKLSGVEKTLASIEATCGPCRATVDRLRGVIDGNGQKGLKTDVAIVKAAREDFQEFQVATSRWQRRQMGAMIGGLLGLLGMVGAYLFT